MHADMESHSQPIGKSRKPHVASQRWQGSHIRNTEGGIVNEWAEHALSTSVGMVHFALAVHRPIHGLGRPIQHIDHLKPVAILHLTHHLGFTLAV